MHGFINLLKTPGITSSTAVSLVKKTFNIKKVGHAGTLDPGAAGVLPIMINKATRLFDYLHDEQKEYISEFVFGTDTDTLDMQGNVLNQRDVKIDEAQVSGIIPEFIGDISQRPPKVSAININGKKAYDLQRSNIEFEIPEKTVTVNDITLIRQSGYNAFLLKIGCSKGTYIRSLCRDMAQKLGTVGYVNYLLRTKSAGFSLENSITIEQLKTMNIEDVITPLDQPIEYMDKVYVKKDDVTRAINGLVIRTKQEIGEIFRVYYEDKFVGLGRPQYHNDIKYIKVFKRFI